MDSGSGPEGWCLHSQPHPQSLDWFRLSNWNKASVIVQYSRFFKLDKTSSVCVCVFSSSVDFPRPLSSCHYLVRRQLLSFSSLFEDSVLLIPSLADVAVAIKVSTKSKQTEKMPFHSIWGNTLFTHPEFEKQLVFFPLFLPVFTLIAVQMNNSHCLPSIHYAGTFTYEIWVPGGIYGGILEQRR